MATVRGSPRSPAAHAGRRLGGRGARSWRARGAPRPGGTRTEVDERSAGVRCQARRRGRARMDHRPFNTQLDGSMRLAARRGEKRCTLSRALALASRQQRERGDGRRLALDRVSERVQYRQHSFPRRRLAAGRRGPPIGKHPCTPSEGRSDAMASCSCYRRRCSSSASAARRPASACGARGLRPSCFSVAIRSRVEPVWRSGPSWGSPTPSEGWRR